MNIRTYFTATVCSFGIASAAYAQDLPAEFPPAGFTESQYVDSEGCAFIRAGISGVVNWIPRMNRQREPLCGFTPSLGADAATAAPEVMASDDAPVINVAPVVEAEPEVVAAVAEAVEPVIAPEPVAAPTASIAAPTVAPVMAPIATVAGPSSPQIISVPPAVVDPVIPTPAVAPRQVTFAEACAGRTGILPGHVTPDGSPVNCGPATAVVAVSAPVAPAAPQPRRVTLTEICAEIAVTGQVVINQATGQPVSCPRAATAPVAAATSVPVVRSVTRLFGGGVPASNPVAAPAPRPTPGYRPVWDDGRVNTQRGLPEARAVAPTTTVATPTARVSSMSVPSTTTSHRYVQVGSFGDSDNATRTAQRLQALGLPVGFANVTRNSQNLRIVAAGPFASAAELNRALQAARSLGFGDAFTRR